MDQEQEKFEFSKENFKKANEIIAKYPKSKQASAIVPLLDLAQRQYGGWIPKFVVEYVADFLNMPYMRAYEVASFYSMLYQQKMGKHHIQVCGTTPCMLRGSEKVIAKCKTKLGIDLGKTTADGKFTLSEVECLGACVDAPVAQIDDDYYEWLTEEKIEEIIDQLSREKN